MTITVEEIADEMVKLSSKWSVDYDAKKAIDELGELFSRLGIDPQADRALAQEGAHALATKKGFRTIILMNVRPDPKPRQ